MVYPGCSILGTVGLFAGQFPELLVDHCPSWAPAGDVKIQNQDNGQAYESLQRWGGGYEKPDLSSLTFHHITARQ